MRKQDIFTAKNYLLENEIDTLNRLVVIFLETAELRAKDRVDINMSFWKENVDRILLSTDKKVLIGSGTISNAQMEEKTNAVYEQFDIKRKTYLATEADKQDLEEIEKQLKTRKNK